MRPLLYILENSHCYLAASAHPRDVGKCQGLLKGPHSIMHASENFTVITTLQREGALELISIIRQFRSLFNFKRNHQLTADCRLLVA